MLVVVPYWAKDAERAIELLCWMRELDGKQRSIHAVLVVGDYGLAQELHDRVKGAAYDAFERVYFTTAQNPEVRGWPFGPNLMFRTTAAYVRKQVKEPFFWCEPDCIPLKAGWLDRLAEEYRCGDRPFMGYVHNKPWLHLTGCAVYPPNMYEINAQPLMANETPWDVIAPGGTLPVTTRTKLIQHVWSFSGDKLDSPAATFPDRASLGRINDDAVVFHRCKDGSLIKALRGGGQEDEQTGKREAPCIVQLGRYGDILNILPVVKAMRDRLEAKTIPMMVSQQFADVLEAVSYVEPVIFEGDYSEVSRAVSEARAKFELVVCTQVWGKDWPVAQDCLTYNMESWRNAGFGDSWEDPAFKLVLDQGLATARIEKGTRPRICINLSGGHSSPFKDWRKVQEHISQTYADVEIIDLMATRLENVAHLLPIIRSAALLITTDTATLHLAAACDTPVVALVNDDPWLATVPRCRCVLKLPYREALAGLGMLDAMVKKYAGQQVKEVSA